MLYQLSRYSRIHNRLRRAAYAVLWRIPDGAKYGVGGALRRYRLPYRLLTAGDTAIQIGAPWDTLRAGRSRAAHFARIVGSRGRVVVVEPGSDSVAAMRAFAQRHDLKCVTVVPTGAWSRPARLRFLVNPAHPSSNLVEEVIDTPERDRGAYQVTEVDVDSLDRITARLYVGAIRLLSVNTNGSDRQIFEGATATLERTEFVAVVTRRCEPLLGQLGFRLLGSDDRGFTYGRTGDR